MTTDYGPIAFIHPRSTSNRLFAALILVLGISLFSLSATAQDALTRYEFSRIEMAVEFRIALYDSTSETANKAAQAAFDRVKQLNDVMSDYDSNSELMRLCAASVPGKPVVVSEDLFTVLEHAQRISELSNGAFDVSVGPLTKLWRRARRQKELPPADDLEAARQLVGFRSIKLDREKKTVELLKPGMRLDLGGIAKGYASDQALAILKQRHITSALVAAAGDIAVSNPPPGKSHWDVAVESLTRRNEPDLHLKLANQAVSTSGDAYQFVEIAGRRYSHIVDPATGVGLSHRSSVTVISPTGMQADALATALSVVGPEKALTLIEHERPAVSQALILSLDEKGEVIRRQSPGFDHFVRRP